MTERDKRKLQSLFAQFANPSHLRTPRSQEELRSLRSYIPSIPIPFVTIAGKQHYHDDTGFKAHEEFVDLILKERDINRYYTGSDITKVIKEEATTYLSDLMERRTTRAQAGAVVDSILARLSVVPEEIEFHFLIDGLNLKDFDDFQLGKVKFRKVDQAYAERLFPDKPGTMPQDASNEGRRERGASILGRTAVSASVRATHWLAEQLAYREVQLTLGALSIYPIIYNFESEMPRLFRFKISGFSVQDFGPIVSFSASGEPTMTIGGLFSTIGMSVDLFARNAVGFQEHGWNSVSDFLQTRSDDNQVDVALENALFWIGQACTATTLPSILLSYFTAIETLIIGRRKTNTIVQDLARRLPILVGHTEDERRKIRNELTKTGGSYDLRSQITHAGLSQNTDRRKIFHTGALAAWTLLRFLKARGFGSLEQAIKSLDQAAGFKQPTFFMSTVKAYSERIVRFFRRAEL